MQKEKKNNPNTLSSELNDWCASIQKSLVEPLVLNIERAIKQTGIRQLAIAGGVSANSHLRHLIQKLGLLHLF